jgi:hypothetical protein
MSFIADHWHGEVPLRTAFWRNGIAVNIGLGILVLMTAGFFRSGDYAQWTETPAITLAAMVVQIVGAVVVAVWQIVGIWRAAGRSVELDDHFWPFMARAAVLADAVLVAYATAIAVPNAVHMAYLARIDRGTVVRTGNVVVLVGLVSGRVGVAADAALQDPAVTTLAISSPGGMVWSAKHIETTVHRRGLTVIAGPQCWSACTFILASGRRRAALPDTRFGFHRAQAIGGIGVVMDFRRDGEDILRWTGANEAFIARALGPQTDRQLYRPPLAELAEQGIITDIFDGGHLVAAKDWCARHPAKAK